MNKIKFLVTIFVGIIVIVGVFLIQKSNNKSVSKTTSKTEKISKSTKEIEKKSEKKKSFKKESDECTPAIGSSAGTIKYGDKTYNILAIGTQQWFRENLNIGTMSNPSNDGKIQKWCYKDKEINCKTYGALYDKNEAMQYINKEGAQGVCPSGWHIPSDNDWKTLELALCITKDDLDEQGWRGSDQGTQVKEGGRSGFNVILAGFRADNGKYYYLDSMTRFLSSTQENGYFFGRDLNLNKTGIFRGVNESISGYSVRCVKN